MDEEFQYDYLGSPLTQSCSLIWASTGDRPICKITWLLSAFSPWGIVKLRISVSCQVSYSDMVTFFLKSGKEESLLMGWAVWFYIVQLQIDMPSPGYILLVRSHRPWLYLREDITQDMNTSRQGSLGSPCNICHSQWHVPQSFMSFPYAKRISPIPKAPKSFIPLNHLPKFQNLTISIRLRYEWGFLGVIPLILSASKIKARYLPPIHPTCGGGTGNG